MTDNRIKDIFKEIITKQHRAGFFTMESHWDKILIFIISLLLFKKKNMGAHVYNVFLHRRYWYTSVIYGVIKEIAPESVVVKKGEELCRKWEKKIGLREYTEEEERDIIINREFTRLSATTIDVIPHAILSNYAKWGNDAEIKEIFDEEVFSIISGKYTIEDPADFFWALQIWMEEKALNTPEYSKETDVKEKLNKYLRKVISDNDTGYFKPPKVPSWDSTPEIYQDIRTTLYILIDLIHIKEAAKEGEIGEKIDNTIKKLSNWINKQERRIYQNPYFSALLLKYKWDEIVKTKTPEEIGSLKQELKNIEENFKKEKIREIIKKVPNWIYYIIGSIAAIITILIFSGVVGGS